MFTFMQQIRQTPVFKPWELPEKSLQQLNTIPAKTSQLVTAY
jgi:hypothetical protein